jgi:outer membrane protein OmpA-like peptidoglycan-associated protein
VRHSILLAAPLAFSLSLPEAARANPVRLHGSAAAAHALADYQKDEFGWGGAALGAVELGLAKQFGLELEISGLWLSKGDDPKDPRFAPKDAGAAGAAALGFRLRPFATAYAGHAFSAAGLWLAANSGVSRTGGVMRPMFDAQLGFDLLYAHGYTGVGPMIGYMQVFQPDNQLRPEDANIALAGLHVMFDTGSEPLVDGDADGDGIRDSVDHCPKDPEDRDGYQDEDGCPDLDNDSDGIPDSADRCPNDPEDIDGFEDQDGCPDLDNDKDGIVDSKDKCPNEPEDKDNFEDEDGCPDLDNDQDGIPDVRDLCPNEPETVNNYADQDGCPDENQVRVMGDKIVLDDRVHFRTNNAIIRPISYPLLERLAKLIKEHQEYIHIDIEGHADERGNEAFNQKLSEDRAQSVLEFLVKRGVERARLTSTGFGTTRPLTPKRGEYAWLLNRRVEFRVTRKVQYTGPEVPKLQQPEGPALHGVDDLPAAQEDENVPSEGKSRNEGTNKPKPAANKNGNTAPKSEAKPVPKRDAPGGSQ